MHAPARPSCLGLYTGGSGAANLSEAEEEAPSQHLCPDVRTLKHQQPWTTARPQSRGPGVS
eukprot:8977335-Pyramimonas_sp.AAC.2